MRSHACVVLAAAILAAPSALRPTLADDALDYRLTAASSYTVGCHPPCLCPIALFEGVEGSVRLVALPTAGAFTSDYEVSEIDWTVPGDPIRRVTGAGTLRRRFGDEPTDEWDLDLSVDGAEPERFASGSLASHEGFPETMGFVVSQNGQVCFDQVFAIEARLELPTGGRFVRGDCNADGALDVSDAVSTLLVLFLGGAPFECRDACDANDDGRADLSDAVFVLSHLFLGQRPPSTPFPGCGVDPTDEGLDCRTFAPCGTDECDSERTAIARESSIVGAATAVVRLDYLSRRILGWQLFVDRYDAPTEEEARERAQADAGFGVGARILGDTPPEDLWIFSVGAGDFGGTAVVSARTGRTVFGGSSVWLGRGDITYPPAWRSPESLGSDCPGFTDEIQARGWNLATAEVTVAPADVDAALEVVRSTALCSGLASSGYIFGATVLLYARTVGAFDPRTAEWIVVIDAGWLE